MKAVYPMNTDIRYVRSFVVVEFVHVEQKAEFAMAVSFAIAMGRTRHDSIR
jgi:hypothetical protein